MQFFVVKLLKATEKPVFDLLLGSAIHPLFKGFPILAENLHQPDQLDILLNIPFTTVDLWPQAVKVVLLQLLCSSP